MNPIRWIIAKIDAAADRNIDGLLAEHDREEKVRREENNEQKGSASE